MHEASLCNNNKRFCLLPCQKSFCFYLPCTTCSDQSHKRIWKQILSCIFMIFLLLTVTNRYALHPSHLCSLLLPFLNPGSGNSRLNTMHFSSLEKGNKGQLAVMQSRQLYFRILFFHIACKPVSEQDSMAFNDTFLTVYSQNRNSLHD